RLRCLSPTGDGDQEAGSRRRHRGTAAGDRGALSLPRAGLHGRIRRWQAPVETGRAGRPVRRMMQLYDWQQDVIDELMHGSGRVLVVAPTGGGKSICFQRPAEQLDGIALVITPLVSLMADQVASLTAR